MNHYNNGLNAILQDYAQVYKKDGKVFVRIFLNCPSIQMVCKSITKIYKHELVEMRKPECLEYAKKFNTDQQTLGDILSLIYYVLRP